jgi:NTP pyrophosphatase (non-canonical NTP hydrolase)
MAESTATLQDDATLSDIQAYVKQVSIERGFEDESIQDKFILLVEEVGELAKELRPMHGVKVADDSTMSEIEHELADILFLVLTLSNKLDIDIFLALKSKEEKNKKRTWSK